MQSNALFRQEVLTRKNQNFGTIFLNPPLKFKILALFSLVILISLSACFYFMEFSEKYVVRGFINTAQALVKVYPSSPGILVETYVKQGQRVQVGEKLCLIQAEIQKNKSSLFLKQLYQRKELINQELSYKKTKISAYKKLREKNYISESTYHRLLEEITELTHKKHSLIMEIAQHKAQKSQLIRSPIAGEVSTMLFKKGQYVHLEKPLLQILPKNTALIAEVFIPVAQSGFVKAQDWLTLRYDAYPYTRFGTAKGRISAISQSILTDSEEEKPIKMDAPYYKAWASLDSAFMNIYGKKRKIRQGMTFSAVILGSKRKLWQWILDPVYSFAGGLSA